MPSFRKKPVVVEARHFVTNDIADKGANLNALVAWIVAGGGMAYHNSTVLFVEIREGEMMATLGDWIIRGVKGEHYPCKPDIFAATYEVVL
jgi:hypothetical protein